MRVPQITAHDADRAASEFGLWPAGDYDFEVYDASEETSAAGNEQIKLTLHVFNTEGARRTVFDYLVGTQGMAYKIRHFAEATGIVAQYEKGDLMPSEIVQRTGRLRLRVKKGTNGYPDQNAVQDYIKGSHGVAAGGHVIRNDPAPRPSSRVKLPAGDIDEEIPF